MLSTVDGMTSGLLSIIDTHQILKKEQDDNRVLACFLSHMPPKNTKIDLFKVVSKVSKCQGTKINQERALEAIRILQGYGGVQRDNDNKVWLTVVGHNAVKNQLFKKYHR